MIEKFIETKNLKPYQMDRRGVLRPVMLMNELQAMAESHAESLGGGQSYCLDNKIAWVVTHWAIEIDWMPDDRAPITIQTWPAVHDALRAIRDFRILDADGRELIRASSQWVLIDMETRRPLRLGDHLPHWELSGERAVNTDFGRFADFNVETSVTIKPRYDDFDPNRHVNNAVYAVWATESQGPEFLDRHILSKLFINFRKEIPVGIAEVTVERAANGTQSYHKISADNEVRALVECGWRAVEPSEMLSGK